MGSLKALVHLQRTVGDRYSRRRVSGWMLWDITAGAPIGRIMNWYALRRVLMAELGDTDDGRAHRAAQAARTRVVLLPNIDDPPPMTRLQLLASNTLGLTVKQLLTSYVNKPVSEMGFTEKFLWRFDVFRGEPWFRSIQAQYEMASEWDDNSESTNAIEKLLLDRAKTEGKRIPVDRCGSCDCDMPDGSTSGQCKACDAEDEDDRREREAADRAHEAMLAAMSPEERERWEKIQPRLHLTGLINRTVQ